MLKKGLTFLLFLLVGGVYLSAQTTISLLGSDGPNITADAYLKNDTLPYMILCHEEKSSRGEYNESAKKFMKLGYNCLAIDLRNGGTKNGVQNGTKENAEEQKLPTGYLDAKADIEAAINYAYDKNHKNVILVGSGYSASLALYIGSSNHKVSAVIAFSPGDYFSGKLKTKEAFENYDKPVFVTSSASESEKVKKYIASIPSEKLVHFTPPNEGAHGSEALLSSDKEYHEYWISIVMFLRQVQTGN